MFKKNIYICIHKNHIANLIYRHLNDFHDIATLLRSIICVYFHKLNKIMLFVNCSIQMHSIRFIICLIYSVSLMYLTRFSMQCALFINMSAN